MALVSLVFRLRRIRLAALKAISARTRIRRSELLREAIADVLTKHAKEVR